VLDTLLSALMKIIIENAGGTHGRHHHDRE
jgi:hypothetical protein